MSIDSSRPLASLGASLLRPRGATRRVPIMFTAAPVVEIAPVGPVLDEPAPLPEVVRQVVRLHDTFAAEPVVGAPAPRVAFTLRLDRANHARLRALARAEGRSAQALLIDAINLYQPAPRPAAGEPAQISRLMPIGRVS